MRAYCLNQSLVTRNPTTFCNFQSSLYLRCVRNLLPKPDHQYTLPITLLVSHCYNPTVIVHDKTQRFTAFSFAQIAALI